MTLGIFDFTYSDFRGTRGAAAKAFGLIVGHQLARVDCQYELHDLPNNRLALVFYGTAIDRARAISGSVQKYYSLFAAEGGDDEEGAGDSDEDLVTYALASPLEAAAALLAFNRMRGGSLRLERENPTPDLADMLRVLTERRMWIEDVRDSLAKVALETRHSKWDKWKEVENLPSVLRLPTNVKDHLEPSAVTGLLELPRDFWAGYLGDLIQHLFQEELYALFQDSKTAHAKGRHTRDRQYSLEMSAIQFLIQTDQMLHARAEQERREKEREDEDTEDFCDEE